MTYLIIGASSGLGRELAKEFAKENCNLIIASRDERDLIAIKSDLEIKYKIKVNIIELDFSSIEEIEKKLFSQKLLIEEIKGVLFPIGTMFEQDTPMLNSENMKKLLHSNFISIAYTIQRLRKHLIKKDNCTITGFGSVSGFLGRRINSVYAGSKRALESYFESLAFDRDFKRINIQFYTLGYLDTNLSYGKNLKLPKGSIKKLSKIVFKNKSKNFKKISYPIYWNVFNLIIKMTPFIILRKFADMFSK
jgi:short-subunit dehydrogenase|tara:strand:- start:4442 stop:5188 length:747 start_codon:yes stop_codon:yes gene_type:complete